MVPRNSEDIPITDIRGEERLERCKAHNLIILNGRKTGDPWGKITSYQWNGRAVVDYVITPGQLFKTVTNVSVGDYSPWVSDHCPLLFEMHSIKPFNKTREYLEELPENSSNYLDPRELTSKITDILIDSCDKAGINPCKQKFKTKNK